ncbi:MAG: hypothetical protein JSW61_01775 [Candidatus Thorarchaeota archaeon]|nr:MAG: hypothetical protein JSW61_01775 [Candidatus Thorarchaeota archaeon]
MSIFPVITTIVAVVFAFLVLKQWLRRHRIYQLIWFVSLVMFAVTAAFEALSEFMGWSVAVYRAYLVLSASQVAIMGSGTLYLILAKNVFSTKGLLAIDGILVGIAGFFSWMMTLSSITDYSALTFGAMEYPIAGIGTYVILIVLALIFGRNMKDSKKKMLHGHIYLLFSIVLTVWMGAYAAVAEVYTENFVAGIAVAGHAMAQHVRNFSPLLSVTGGFLLIGAAFFSFVKTRFTFNLWIALGGLAIAVAGSIARSGAEFGNVLYLGEVVGVLLLTKGFYDSDRMIREKHEKTTGAEIVEQSVSSDISE